MLLKAFAKINWSIDITGVRPDGYHLMDMVMQPISLPDEIALSESPFLSISTDGYPLTRADDSNLAMRAASALRQYSGTERGAHIHVHKRIPMGAGLGGGSADAAAVLFGLNRIWDLNYPREELERIGLSLGADIPFFLHGGLTRTTGIGEMIEEHSCRSNYWLLVFQPCRGLSTGEIFSSFCFDNIRHPDTAAVLNALESGDLGKLASCIGNVLEPFASLRRPEIREAVSSLLQNNACISSMTGSGSAVFGVFRSRSAAESAQKTLSRRWKHIHLCHTQSDSIRVLEE